MVLGNTKTEIKMKEYESNLTEAELSSAKNSLAALCKKYITGSFFDKLVDTTGISQAKDILLGDLKNMIGRGTSAPAAKRFVDAIVSARNSRAVDTILANYMLAGDGMRSGIGYNESTSTDHIEAFRKFLSESRKNDMKCDGKSDKSDKKPTEEEIAEAMKIVEEHGYTAVKIDEQKGCCGKCEKDEKKDKKKDDEDDKKLKEALSIIEGCGKKVVKESEEDQFTLHCDGICDPDGLKALIDNALATGNLERDVADAIVDIITTGESVKIFGDPDVMEDPETGFKIYDGIEKFLENAPGIEVEVGEDVIDHWKDVFKRSQGVEGNRFGLKESVNDPDDPFGNYLADVSGEMTMYFDDVDKDNQSRDKYYYALDKDEVRRELARLFKNGVSEEVAAVKIVRFIEDNNIL